VPHILKTGTVGIRVSELCAANDFILCNNSGSSRICSATWETSFSSTVYKEPLKRSDEGKTESQGAPTSNANESLIYLNQHHQTSHFNPTESLPHTP